MCICKFQMHLLSSQGKYLFFLINTTTTNNMNAGGAMSIFPASFQWSHLKRNMSPLWSEMWDWIGRYCQESCPGIADITPLTAACGSFGSMKATILIKNSVLGFDIQVKLKKTLMNMSRACPWRRRGAWRELVHALKRREGLVYASHVELILLAVSQQSDRGCCSWISWKINARTGSQQCPERGKAEVSCCWSSRALVALSAAASLGLSQAPGDAGRVQLTVWVAVCQGMKCMKWSHSQSKAPGRCIIYHPASGWCLVWS